MLATHNLTIGYAANTIARNICCSLPEAKLTVLIGANGSGKSTLLRTLTGAQAPLSGTVTLGGDDISGISPRKLALRLSLVLTDRTGGGGLRVDELVAIGRHPHSGFLGRLGPDDRDAVERAIELVGLSHRRTAFAASLSDGERQKAMIARAIAQDTPLIVLDEPTSFLDVSSRFEIMELLGRLVSERGTTVLLSTHDIAPAMAVAGNVWAMRRSGTESELICGHPDRLAADGVLDTVYENVYFDAEAADFRRRQPMRSINAAL